MADPDLQIRGGGAIKFVLLSFFTLVETIQLKIWAKSMLRNVKSPLPVDMRRSKMPLLKFPGDIACLTSPGWIEAICICNQRKI